MPVLKDLTVNTYKKLLSSYFLFAGIIYNSIIMKSLNYTDSDNIL